jgi:two-component system phosphate regulon response regulator PhoB
VTPGAVGDVATEPRAARDGVSDASAAANRPRPRVLVVEDEMDIAALVAYQLTREGYRVETAGNGADALAAVHRELPSLVILDRMLPGLSGDEVLKALKAEAATRFVPVLVLTARREQEERIKGLEMGADDYLTKPFSPRELVLRVGAILRRWESPALASGGRLLAAGPLRVDVDAHRATVDNQEVQLTPTEFRLLQTLLERRGRTQSRRQLLESVWDMGSDVSERIETRTVDMHVRRLRAKLGDAGDLVETVRGFGYRFKPE